MQPVLPGYPILKVGVAVFLDRRTHRERSAGRPMALGYRIDRWCSATMVNREVNLQRAIGAVRYRAT